MLVYNDNLKIVHEVIQRKVEQLSVSLGSRKGLYSRRVAAAETELRHADVASVQFLNREEKAWNWNL
jgi:hypothetical protein